MNLALHIIKKDLRRLGWVFVMWAVTGGYMIAYRKVIVIDRSIWDNLGIISLLTHGALSLALIAGIVQEDGLTQGNEFWRTRPIGGARLLAAKLGLILACFVVLPVALIALLKPHFDPADLRFVVPIVAVVVLSCTAMASCTKSLGHYLLGGIFCIMAVVLVGPLLVSQLGLGAMSKAELMQVSVTRMYLIFGLCAVASVAILANQYFTRRTAVSIGIVMAAVVGVTLLGSLWRWSLIG